MLADILWEDTLETCERIWTCLPLEMRAIHGMYSGAGVFTMLDDPPAPAAENLVQLPLPGELLYFYDEGRGAVGSRKPVGRDLGLTDLMRTGKDKLRSVYRSACRPCCIRSCRLAITSKDNQR